LIFAHVNHLLRGDESDADEVFVQTLAASLGVACHTTRIDMAALAGREHGNLESIARRERYAWLTRLAQAESAAWIATGHTADDQAETVLHRLLRGSGLLGLSGMAERRPLADSVSLVRPLLSVRREMLLEYLTEKQIGYRVDSSNRDLRFTRNRIRLELMPALEAHYNPAAVTILCRLADQAHELNDQVAAQAAALLREAELPRAGNMLVFAAPRLLAAPSNLIREMFRLVWQREAWPMADMDFARWHWLVEILIGSRVACDFPGRLHVRRKGDVLQILVPS
jgi:tRNA(Ile)-lysidine synthase